MEKEINLEIIKATQTALGKHLKRPQLTDKLLKKPPFRFLHDIVTGVIKATGFFDGLFEDDELISENVKDRDNKLLFLHKTITILNMVTGKTLAAKPSKIVAGQEPEKTNELLQCLAFALDNKLNSDDAVRKYNETAKESDKKIKGSIKTNNKNDDVKKLVSQSSEKLSMQKKKDKDESNLSKHRDKTTSSKTVHKDPKKEVGGGSKKPQIGIQPKPNKEVKKINNEKTQNQTKSSVTKLQNPKSISGLEVDNEQSQNSESINSEAISKSEVLDTKSNTNTEIHEQNTLQIINQNVKEIQSSNNIKDLNSSLSSQDLMQVDTNKTEEKKVESNTETKIVNDQIINEKNTNDDNERPSLSESTIAHLETNRDQQSTNIVRPLSVRPPSSRPGAPRLKEKHDTMPNTENLLIGKVNIISESTTNNEEDDSSIIIVDQQSTLSLLEDQPDQLQLSSNHHGHLVKQILESHKEFSQNAGRTEIEWQFGVQKSREALNKEIDDLRFNIQAVSRVANPLGKLLDHIKEDAELMRQELLQWTKTFEETSKELAKLKLANEDSLLPLRTKLKQLDANISEKHEKINDLKIAIYKNSSRIDKLLASGGV